MSYSESEEFIDPIVSGLLLRNKYILIRKIGSGSFATVWLSYNIQNRTFVAIKIQNPEDIDAGEDEVELFKRMKNDPCPYLNKMLEDFIDVIEDGEYLCMVFKLMACSVYDIIKKGKYAHGLPEPVAKKVMYQTLLAMDRLNTKYKQIHTDIKPENILIEGINDNNQKIIDAFNKLNFNKFLNKSKGKKGKGKVSTKTAALAIIKKMSLPPESDSESESGEDSEEDSDCEYQFHECPKDTKKDRKCEYTDVSIIRDEFVDKNIQVKLSDFGSCCDITHDLYDIQTRYYRSPEIILNYPYNETCDIWSMACLFYELLTGELLFDPDRYERFNRDRNHIHDMRSLLGKIPDNLINQSEKKKVFIKKNGLTKGKTDINFTPLSKRLQNKLPEEEFPIILDLLYNMLSYDPKKRYTAKQCLAHPYFN